MIGSARGTFGRAAVGSFSAMLAERARCSVVIVRSSPSFDRMVPSPVRAILDIKDDLVGGEKPSTHS